MLASVLEAQIRAGGDVPDRCRHEDLARRGRALDARRDVDRDSAQVSTLQLAFPRVDTRADLDAQTLHRGGDGARALEGMPRRFEAHEEPVAGGTDLGSLASDDLPANRSAMLVEQFLPPRIP